MTENFQDFQLMSIVEFDRSPSWVHSVEVEGQKKPPFRLGIFYFPQFRSYQKNLAIDIYDLTEKWGP